MVFEVANEEDETATLEISESTCEMWDFRCFSSRSRFLDVDYSVDSSLHPNCWESEIGNKSPDEHWPNSPIPFPEHHIRVQPVSEHHGPLLIELPWSHPWFQKVRHLFVWFAEDSCRFPSGHILNCRRPRTGFGKDHVGHRAWEDGVFVANEKFHRGIREEVGNFHEFRVAGIQKWFQGETESNLTWNANQNWQRQPSVSSSPHPPHR